MTLHETIISDARDEVQKEYGMTHRPFEDLQRTLQLVIFAEAAKRAMEKQALFLEWKAIQVFDMLFNKTELQLYTIWKGEQK